MDPFVYAYWPFHLVNYVLAVVIYTLVGRFLLGLVIRPDSDNYIWRFFRRLTDPVLRVMNWLIPGYIAAGLRPLVAAFHLYVARVALFLVLYAQGMVPRLEGNVPMG